MKDVHAAHYAKEVQQKLARNGLFLVTGGNQPNVLTIGWGGLNFYWKKTMFVVPVRFSRFTHDLLEQMPEFTVCVPMASGLNDELAFCGTKSGRDVNKFEALGLTPQPSKTVRAPGIAQCGLIYECKVIYRQSLDPSGFTDLSVRHSAYAKGDFHTLFYGEVTACYLNE